MPMMQVFCFFISQEGNAFAYASPNFQAALDQPHLDALKQVTVSVLPVLTSDMCLNHKKHRRSYCKHVAVVLQPQGAAWKLHTACVPICSLAAVAHGSVCA